VFFVSREVHLACFQPDAGNGLQDFILFTPIGVCHFLEKEEDKPPQNGYWI
jgi:hypothetical protein